MDNVIRCIIWMRHEVMCIAEYVWGAGRITWRSEFSSQAGATSFISQSISSSKAFSDRVLDLVLFADTCCWLPVHECWSVESAVYVWTRQSMMLQSSLLMPTFVVLFQKQPVTETNSQTYRSIFWKSVMKWYFQVLFYGEVVIHSAQATSSAKMYKRCRWFPPAVERKLHLKGHLTQLHTLTQTNLL